MNNSLSPRKIPRAPPLGFSSGSGYISPYILTQVIIHTFSSKIDTSSIVLPGWAILIELIFRIALAARPLFSSIHNSIYHHTYIARRKKIPKTPTLTQTAAIINSNWH